MVDFFERIRQPDKHSTYDDQVLEVVPTVVEFEGGPPLRVLP
jgi:hypothetical protein